MDIAAYIKELVLLNEGVILPGFGGFISRYSPARIDPDKQVFTPPSKKIEFRQDMKKDNGLLINHIARKNRISGQMAGKLVGDFVNEMNGILSKGNKVTLEGLGSFRKDMGSNRIIFTSFSDENYLIDSYGLPNLELTGLKSTGNQDNQELHIPPIKTINRKRTGFWVVSSIVILVVLLIFIIPYNESGNLQVPGFNFLSGGRSDNAAGENAGKIIFGERRITGGDSVKHIIEDVIDRSTKKKIALAYDESENYHAGELKKETLQTKNQREEDFQKEDHLSETSKYYLIAGSFKSLENARKLRAELTGSGFDPQILQTRNGYFRVTLSSFQNRNVAIRELQRIRKGLNRPVWILSI